MSRQTSTPIPEAVRGGQAAPPGVASSDLLRFQRLFDRTIGLGFKLVIWETPTAGDRASVLAWLASCSATNSARLIEVDLGRLLGRSGNVARRSLNVWSALTSAVPPEDVGDHRAVLVLSGFEELLTDGAPDRPHLLQQFNIQRDILVRDYPCWWLLLTHPAWRQQWRTVAPDFCDFVALWIESPWPAAEAGADRTARMDTSQERPASEEGLAPADWPAALRAAHAAIRASRLDMALDRIYSFRVAATSPQRTERALAVADLLEGDILNLRGNSGEALRRWRDRALPVFQRLELAQEQGMALDRIGDALFQRGDTAEARRLYLKSLAIAERLAQAEPERADYQRDLAGASRRMGNVYRALGQAEPAREAYLKSLAIAERLAQAEPERADYQRDLAVAYIKMGDLSSALGQGEATREAYLKSLAIIERLAQAEPERADYQYDLARSYSRLGDLYSARGQREAARETYLKSLAIAERLAQAEPERADYQRDLSVSYNKVGDLYRALGQGEPAREAYLKSLAIAERLAQAEPERADYQRDLVVSYWRLGTEDEPAAERHLRRALGILMSLKESGRLDPVDEPWIPRLREFLRQRGFSDA